MFSWSSNPDRLHQLCGAVTLPLVHLAFLFEDLSPHPPPQLPRLVFQFPGHFWKAKSGPGKPGWQIQSICRRPPFVKTAPGRCWDIKKNQKNHKLDRETQKGLHLEKKKTRSIRAVKSDGTVKRGPQAEETGAPPTNHPLSPPTNIHFIHWWMSKPMIYFRGQRRGSSPDPDWAASPHVILEMGWSDEMKWRLLHSKMVLLLLSIEGLFCLFFFFYSKLVIRAREF